MPPDGRTPILYIAPWVDLGGSDKGTIDWFKHIDRKRWAPSLITTQPSPNRWLHKVEPFAEEIWELPDLMVGARFPEFILGFVESRGVRLVHVMNSRLGFDLLPDLASLPEPPAVVVQMHAEEPNQVGYVRYATRRYGNLIDAFSVVSEDLKGTIADYEIPPSRIEVIHLGVDGEEFDPARVEPLPLDGAGVPRILWPGRLVEQKDPMLTLDVLADARRNGAPEFVLDVVGEGHLEPALRARAEDLGVADVIRWHPPSQEMPRWYRSADLTLMTSLYEGVPYVIYESLAMGVPVVAPALPGNLEIMDDDNGVLVEPRDDAERYAKAIAELLQSPERRVGMGERSRRRMLSEFSLEEMGRRHDELYEQLLGARPAGSRWRLEGDEAASTGVATSLPPPLRLPRDPHPEPSVGVGVPCFKHGIFLDECIRSIKRQTLAPAQIVVVDDHSDDPETIEALERWDADPEVTILRQPANLGPSAARNRALELFDTSYALWLDADDQLLPGALDSMVAKLEAAPEQVGFIYPHAQHIGNRTDYVEMPAYNLWLLMQEGYCPSPALFDRRVFDHTGVSYPEDLVVGHEDWDLILQLAERGIRGLHADGPTFLYRKQGFSRISAGEFGPHDFHRALEDRHPGLYRERDRIKAEWAPALSIVLVEPGTGWSAADLRGLEGQTCRDFEVVAPAELQEAIHAARGRWVCLLTRPVAPMPADPAFVERLLRGFEARDEVAAIVLGDAPGIAHHAFSQLDDAERAAAQPIGVAFERPAGGSLPKIDLTEAGSVLADLVIGLQASGIVQWRLAPANGERAARPRPAPGGAERPAQLDLNYDRAGDRSDAAMRRILSWQAPQLPRLTPGTVRRWKDSPSWVPPGTQPLCRHVQIDGEVRVVTNDRTPPPGFEAEFDLGVVQLTGAPGAQRLIRRAGTFELSDDQDEPREGHGLGYVEEQALPLLDRLELRRMPDGQRVLVAGSEDPLFEIAEPIALLGWIDAFPVLPRGELLHVGPWGAVVLRREVDAGAGRHRYRADSSEGDSNAVVLGSIFSSPGRDLVALRLRDDGRLATDLARPGRASRDPRKLARWIAQPRRSHDRDRRWSPSARAWHLARHWRQRRLSEDEGVPLGWLRRERLPGSSPLFSTTHPVTGDQLVTCDPDEARRLDYLPDGVLGFILDAGADRDADAPPHIVPWAGA
jgi:glycosyltransferase involved in cell wall biosynthesis